MTADLRPLDAEAAVVGSILIDPRCLPVVEQLLRPEDLALEINRVIYRAALSLRRGERPIDPVLIQEEAERQGTKLETAYLLGLMDNTPTAQNVEAYAKITRRHSSGGRWTSCATGPSRRPPRESRGRCWPGWPGTRRSSSGRA